MNATLFKKEIKSNWLLLVIFLAVLSVYGSMITMMFNPEMGDSLKMMADSMPDLFAAFGMADFKLLVPNSYMSYIAKI